MWGGGGRLEEDVDVEAFALNAMGECDDVLAMALGSDVIMPTHHPHMPAHGHHGTDSMLSHHVRHTNQSMASYTGMPGTSTTGSRLFERWAAAPAAQDPNAHHIHNGTIHIMGLNSSDSEAEQSMASTASGTRTPVSDCLLENEAHPGSPELLMHAHQDHSGMGGYSQGMMMMDNDNRRRQLAFLIGYVGTEFTAFDSTNGGRTVEYEMLNALRKSGLLMPSDTFERLGWSRAAPTEEGVHATAQCVAFDVMPVRTSLQVFAERLNSKLPPDVRVLNCATCDHVPGAAPPKPPANARFDAGRDAQCVVYEYVVPSAFLAPIPDNVLRGGVHAMHEYMRVFRLTKKQEKSVNAAMRMFQTGGTKGMPWYRDRLDYRVFLDPRDIATGDTRRSVKACGCGERPVIAGVEHVCMRFEGAGFTRGQVRRMAGLVLVAVQARAGCLPEVCIHVVCMICFDACICFDA